MAKRIKPVDVPSPLVREYQDYLKKGPVKTLYGPGGAGSAGGASSSAPKGSGGGGQSPLNWIIDIASRPLYAVTGAINSNISASGSGKNPIDIATSTIAGAWNGFWSENQGDKKTGTDIIDNIGRQIAKRNGDTYKPPTFKSVDDRLQGRVTVTDDGKVSYADPGVIGDALAAIGRGVGGFAVDMFADPLTYVGAGPIIKGAKVVGKALSGVKGVSKATKAADEAASVAAETSRAAAQSPKAVEQVADQVRAEAIASGGRTAAPASRQMLPAPKDVGAPPTATIGRDALGRPAAVPARAETKTAFASTPKRTAAAELPKVSETIGTHSPEFVKSVLGAVDDIARRAKGASAPKTAAEEVAQKAAPSTPDVQAFARDFFKEAGDTAPAVLKGVQMKAGGPRGDIFPSTIVNQLGKMNFQGQMDYLTRLGRAASSAGEGGAEARRFLGAVKEHLTAVRTGAAAPVAAPKAAKAAAAPTTNPSELLHTLLRDTKSPVRADLKKALGPELFGKMSRARSAVKRDAMFNDIVKLATKADEVSPAGFDAMASDVKGFVERSLNLTRVDFDAVARQRQLDLELGRATGTKLFDRTTARAVPADVTKGVQAFTGLSHGELMNRWNAGMKRIIGDSFDPKKGRWRGGQYIYDSPEGTRYVVTDGQINQYAMTSWFMDTLKKIDDALPIPKGQKMAPARVKTKARREQIPPQFREIENVLEENGVKMGARIDKELVEFKPSHIFDASDALVRSAGTDAGRALREMSDLMLWNPGTSIPFSNLVEAIGRSLAGKLDTEILAALVRSKGAYKGGRSYRRQPLLSGGRGSKAEYTAEQLQGMAMQFVKDITPIVDEYRAGYLADYVRKSTADASAMATTIEKQVAAASAQGDGPAFATFAELEQDLLNLSREAGASPEATQLAAEELSKQIPQGIVTQSRRVGQVEGAMRNAAASGRSADEIRAMGVRTDSKHTPVLDEAVIDEADLADMAKAQGDDPAEFYGLGSKVAQIEVQTQSALARMFDPLRRFFDVRYGASARGIDMYETVRSAAGVTSRDIYEINSAINKIAQRHNTVRLGDSQETAMSAAFKLLQRGDREVTPELLALPGGEQIAAALPEVEQLTRRFFDVDGIGHQGDLFWRSATSNIRYLERAWENVGLKSVHADPFTEWLAKGQEADFWRHLDIENPAEFFTKYNSAVHQALSEKVVMDQLIKTLREAGGLSDAAQPGFFRPTLNGKSFFYAGLEGSGLYIDRHVLDAMSSIDRNLHAARSFGDTNLITKHIDPVLGAWKTNMTIYRAGHHVRNTLSNGGLSYIAEGHRNLARSGAVAARLLGLRRGGGARGLDGMSEVERLLTGQQGRLTNGSENNMAFGVGVGKKRQEVTWGELNDAVTERGMLRTFAQAEDILSGTPSITKKAADLVSFRGTKVEKVAGRLSEGLDHHGIVQQFTQIVMNNLSKVGHSSRFPTRAALYDYAAKRSYRFHPDSMALTAGEAKYMRRVFAFYTWFRGTLPAVLEAVAMHPGRATAFHKASFNIAQTMGMDPESFANPWPADADVPEYLRERVFGPNFRTPDGTMYSMDPGFAHTDIARQLLGRAPEDGESPLSSVPGNALRMLVGMLNPLIKNPLELSAGVKLDTGQKINSLGDYLDDSTPFLNYLSSSTGISFAGTALDPATAIQQGRPVERFPVQKGYVPSIFDEGVGDRQYLKALNWLFGQSVQKVGTTESAKADKAAMKARQDAKKSAEAAR